MGDDFFERTARRDETEKADAHSSFTLASRGINGVLLAASAAVLAGVGQLAGSNVLATRPAPRAVLTAVILAMLAIVSGMAFLLASFASAAAHYELKHGTATPTGRKLSSEARQKQLKTRRAALEPWFSRLTLIQLGLWLMAAAFYAFVLLHVTDSFRWSC